jgi:glycosyltransferase involved in cell wall biosynthesis
VSSRPLLLLANSQWNLAHFRADLIRALAAEGFPLAAAVPAGDPPVGRLPTYAFPLKADSIAPAAELRTLLGLIRILRSVRPAAVLSFTPKGNIYGGLAARATGTPVLPNVSGLGTAFIRGGFLQRISIALYREAFRTAPAVFFQNRDDQALFKRLGIVAPDQGRLIPGSGVDCRHFRRVPLPSRQEGEAELLFIGRLLGDKGVRELVAAMRQVRPSLPKVRLTLLGDLGAANRTAISAAEVAGWEAEGLCRHAGRTEDVRPFIAAADAVVLPSYREGMPRALLEAAAMGRPLLASDVPGCRELVSHEENGLLFEVRSAASLAAAIQRFAATPLVARRRWGGAARRVAEERFDQRYVAEAYRQALIALTDSAG